MAGRQNTEQHETICFLSVIGWFLNGYVLRHQKLWDLA